LYFWGYDDDVEVCKNIIICPSCGARLRLKFAAQSGDIIRLSRTISTNYSDEKYPIHFDETRPDFTQCHKCSIIFKVDYTSAVAMKNGGKSSEWIRPLSVNGYLEALKEGLYNSGAKRRSEREEDLLKLRVLLWRALNRKGVNRFDANQKAFYDNNCRKILSLLKGDSVDKLILKAELHRNLGEFAQSKSMLNAAGKADPNSPLFRDNLHSEQSELIEIMKKACDNNNPYTIFVYDKSQQEKEPKKYSVVDEELAKIFTKMKAKNFPGEHISIPYGFTKIGSEILIGRNDVKSITIPDSVISIGACAFQDNANLISVTIPDSVKHIGINAFDGCPKVTVYSSKISSAFEYCRENGIAWAMYELHG
jgi:hypothetical protein